MLGTNDILEMHWEGEQKFAKDYKDMVQRFMKLPSKPKIYLMIPHPLYKESYDNKPLKLEVNDEVLPRVIPEIAKDLGLKKRHVINLYELLGGKDRSEYELFCDGQSCDHVHPTPSRVENIRPYRAAAVASATCPRAETGGGVGSLSGPSYLGTKRASCRELSCRSTP